MKKRILFLVFILGSFQLLNCQESSANQFKDRVGLTLGGASGFTKVPIGELTDGTIVSISFGAGTVVKFEYGHVFGHHFDLALNVGGQFSMLDEEVNNANMSFNRSNLSLTASYVLPLSGMENMRFRFGAGFDLLYNAQLNFDLSAIPDGTTDDWKYNTAFGEHLVINYECDLSKRFSLNAGLKLKNANYSFKSGTNSAPGEENLINPKGSGIDFLIGVCYNFNWKK